MLTGRRLDSGASKARKLPPFEGIWPMLALAFLPAKMIISTTGGSAGFTVQCKSRFRKFKSACYAQKGLIIKATS